MHKKIKPNGGYEEPSVFKIMKFFGIMVIIASLSFWIFEELIPTVQGLKTVEVSDPKISWASLFFQTPQKD